MSDKPIPINTSGIPAGFVAPTPQNTPLATAPIAQQGLSKPTVPDIEEGSEEGEHTDEEDDLPGHAELSATMLGMVQGKLAGLVGKSSGYIESLPLPVRKRIEGLKGVHTKFTKLEAEYKREVLELDRKYSALYKPVFERRYAILSGESEPTEEEVKTGFEEVTRKDDPDAEPLEAQEGDEEATEEEMKGIPQFWLTALRNHPEISEVITERDEEALKSLTNIQLEYLADTPGFKLTFRFAPNDYFTNDILTKTYYYQQELDYMGDFTYQKAEGTKIEWKADKDLTQTVEVRKQRNKNTNRTRVVKKTKKTPSFFDFFNPPAQPTPEEEADMDEEVIDELEVRLEVDYSIGEDLKERIIPRAIDYFTGKALEFDDDLDGEIDSDLEGFEDEDADQESEDDDVPARKKVTGRKKGGAAAAAGGDGECKNQ